MSQQRNPDDSTIASNDQFASTSEQTRELPLAMTTKATLIGTKLNDRYLIERELGRGGIGAVYLARDKPELHARRVVVKVLLEDSLKDEWVVQKFHQEIESLTRLDDPGVVGIFDAGTLPDGAPFLVMQYVDGVSLRAEIKPGGMDLSRAVNIIRQMGGTLAAAHAAGIIHRDLKPENIMLRRVTGGGEQVKVIDFGIAKIKDSVIAPSTVTGAGVAGTIGYMSPEQLNARSINAVSDIYAVGVIVYEMLTGIRPFNPETAFQLDGMQQQGPQVPPRAIRPGIPEAAQRFILKALTYNPSDRPQKIGAFCEELAHALTSEEAPTPQPSVVSQAEPLPLLPERTQAARAGASGQRKLLIPLILLLAIGTAVAGVWLWTRRGAENAPPPANVSNSPSASAEGEVKRTLVYSLIVQKMSGTKPVGDEFQSTGQEIYGNNWKFRVRITPQHSGALYLLNEGAGANGAVDYNVLYPTPENGKGEALLMSNQKMQTGWYFFDENPGTEKLWIIWSKEALPELDAIFKEAAHTELIIKDPMQIRTVRRMLDEYNSKKPQTEIDRAKKQTVISGVGDVLVSLLELSHEKY